MDSETSQPSTELNTPAPPTKDQDNRRHSAEDHPCPTPETDHPTKPAPNQLHSRKIEDSRRSVMWPTRYSLGWCCARRRPLMYVLDIMRNSHARILVPSEKVLKPA